METKTVAHHVFTGLGFPVMLDNVVFTKWDNQWFPKIDIEEAAIAAVDQLMNQREPLNIVQEKFWLAYIRALNS